MPNQMTLEDITGKKVKTITKADGGYWVVLEDGSAVGFTGQLCQVDSNTFQTAVNIQSLSPQQSTEIPQPEAAEGESDDN